MLHGFRLFVIYIHKNIIISLLPTPSEDAETSVGNYKTFRVNPGHSKTSSTTIVPNPSSAAAISQKEKNYMTKEIFTEASMLPDFGHISKTHCTVG